MVWNQLGKLKISCTRPVKERQTHERTLHGQEQNIARAYGKHESHETVIDFYKYNHMHCCAEGLTLQCLSFL